MTCLDYLYVSHCQESIFLWAFRVIYAWHTLITQRYLFFKSYYLLPFPSLRFPNSFRKHFQFHYLLQTHPNGHNRSRSLSNRIKSSQLLSYLIYCWSLSINCNQSNTKKLSLNSATGDKNSWHKATYCWENAFDNDTISA